MLSTAVPAQRRTEQSLAREKVKAALTDFQIKEQSLKKQERYYFMHSNLRKFWDSPHLHSPYTRYGREKWSC